MGGLGSNRGDLGPEGGDLGPEGALLGPRKPPGGGDVRTYVTAHPCVLQDIGPLGPLPKKVNGAAAQEEPMTYDPVLKGLNRG